MAALRLACSPITAERLGSPGSGLPPCCQAGSSAFASVMFPADQSSSPVTTLPFAVYWLSVDG